MTCFTLVYRDQSFRFQLFLFFLTPVPTFFYNIPSIPTLLQKLPEYSFNLRQYCKNDFIRALYPVFDRSQRRPESDCVPFPSKHRPSKPRRIHRWWGMQCRYVVLKLAGADLSPINRMLQRRLMLLNARMADLTLWHP